MSKKQYIGIIILAVIILGVAFYWYNYRPSQIKKECFEIARKSAIEKSGLKDKFYKDDYDTYYKWCLQKKGL